MTTVPGDPAPLQPSSKPRTLSNFAQRVITGVVIAPLVLALVMIGGWPFILLAGFLALVGALEFSALGHQRDIEGVGPVAGIMAVGVVAAFALRLTPWVPLILLAGFASAFLIDRLRHPGQVRRSALRAGLTTAAAIYIGIPTGCLVMLRTMSDGLLWTLMVLLLTWGTDSLAYVGGRLWGKTKLAPTISPKKTVEGAIAGVVGGILPAALLLGLTGRLTPTILILLGAGPLVAILGDLVESGLKRALNVKDSHLAGFDVFPGHGGVLDRVDGLILVATVSTLYLLLTGLAH